jgi:hypothetical protein
MVEWGIDLSWIEWRSALVTGIVGIHVGAIGVICWESWSEAGRRRRRNRVLRS